MIKIIPPDGSDESPTTSFGTKVVDVKTGIELPNVAGIEVRFVPGEIIMATVTICADLEVSAVAKFLFPNDSGDLKEIGSIEFVDGSTRTLSR